MTLLVVRHAKAGKRKEWSGDDRLRPLDERGRRQARGLVDALAAYEVTRILSSAYDRCTQTVEPLAAERGLPVEPRGELEEGAARDDALGLLTEVGAGGVFCTHGDVLEELFGEAGQKGSTRVADLVAGEPVVREYIAPPG